MSDREDLVRQFCDVTGATEDRSRFFLESSNWQLEVALSSFFEHGGNADASVPTPGRVVLSSDDSPSPSPPARQRRAKRERPSGGGVVTLDSLQRDSSSDEEEGEAFYAGGSERSGQQILGPNRRMDMVSEMFKSARARGAIAEDEETAGRPSGFSGTGYRLGQTADDHTVVPSARSQSEEPRSVRLRLYREGFTVDSGALRLYSDRDNAEFLNCIRRGEIPPELAAGGEVRVSLEDRRHEGCPSAAAKTPSFSGKGHMLGSPTPPTVGATAPVAVAASDREANERAAQAALQLDETQPITTVQIRLADGSRLIARFNQTHRVQNIREYITTALPEYQLRNFVLMTTFPSAELKDPDVTLADGNLLNAVIVQRIV